MSSPGPVIVRQARKNGTPRIMCENSLEKNSLIMTILVLIHHPHFSDLVSYPLLHVLLASSITLLGYFTAMVPFRN